MVEDVRVVLVLVSAVVGVVVGNFILLVFFTILVIVDKTTIVLIVRILVFTLVQIEPLVKDVHGLVQTCGRETLVELADRASESGHSFFGVHLAINTRFVVALEAVEAGEELGQPLF